MSPSAPSAERRPLASRRQVAVWLAVSSIWMTCVAGSAYLEWITEPNRVLSHWSAACRPATIGPTCPDQAVERKIMIIGHPVEDEVAASVILGAGIPLLLLGRHLALCALGSIRQSAKRR
jgi:hypothetical protein